MRENQSNQSNQSENDNTPKKTGRDKFFEMKIQMAYKKKAVIVNMVTSDTSGCINILRSNRFVSQPTLEDVLFELTVNDSGRSVHLKNFSGQLQKDQKTGTLFWRVFLETESVTTGRRIGLEVTKQLEENMEKSSNNDYGPLTTVGPVERSKLLRLYLKCLLFSSEWYPGYFNQDTLKLSELLKKEEVQQSIKDAPEKYRLLVLPLLKDKDLKDKDLDKR